MDDEFERKLQAAMEARRAADWAPSRDAELPSGPAARGGGELSPAVATAPDEPEAPAEEELVVEIAMPKRKTDPGEEGDFQARVECGRRR